MSYRNVLDKGFIDVVDILGSDITVVNSARVSFGRRVDTLTEDDERLIRYLARNKHWSPFRHIMVQFHVKAPEFVMRQWYKHVVGIEWTSSYPTKDHGWNEISRRYVEIDDYYIPDIWRLQSDSNKQASQYDENGDPVIDGNIQETAKAIALLAQKDAQQAINALIEIGVAKEQAQIFLPLNFYTEIYWTASFQSIMNFLELRNHEHAQWEIRQYALVVQSIMEELFPISTNAWMSV